MQNYHPVSYSAVKLTGGFWEQRQRLNREATLPAVYDRFAQTGRFAALRCDWDEDDPKSPKPHIFWDSDVAKWMEAAAYVLQKERDPALEQLVDDAIAQIEQNQESCGYFNSYFIAVDPENRFVNRDAHELYCAGHLMEAAVAYNEATGKDTLLRCMCKYADYIEQVFVKEESAEFATCGHEEIELALLKLYRCTREPRYLELSRHFLERRGREEKDLQIAWMKPCYSQSHLPIREQETAEGHAVRAMYLYCAMADLEAETQDESLFTACDALFRNISEKRMYVTGGIGSSANGEAFTLDYDLPNASAYAETCAAIGLALFARRMSALAADSLYADVAERALYNGFLSGTSLDGRAFFYENPLERDPYLHGRDVSVNQGGTRWPILERQEVFDCSCCPPNIARLVASLGDFLYSHDENTIFVHHYMQSDAAFAVGHAGVFLRQETEYPRNGRIKLTVRSAKSKTLALRIPGWCENFTLQRDGEAVQRPDVRRGYCYLPCKDEETVVQLNLEMRVRLLEANPAVQENAGRVAVMHGPFVYCLEEADNGKYLRSLALAREPACTLVFDQEMQSYAIETQGWRRKSFEGLYAKYAPRWEEQTLRLIPYFAFANRGAGEMVVWVQVIEESGVRKQESGRPI